MKCIVNRINRVCAISCALARSILLDMIPKPIFPIVVHAAIVLIANGTHINSDFFTIFVLSDISVVRVSVFIRSTAILPFKNLSLGLFFQLCVCGTGFSVGLELDDEPLPPPLLGGVGTLGVVLLEVPPEGVVLGFCDGFAAGGALCWESLAPLELLT